MVISPFYLFTCFLLLLLLVLVVFCGLGGVGGRAVVGEQWERGRGRGKPSHIIIMLNVFPFSPVLFTLCTNDCRSEIASINPILKFADDTAVLGLIKNKNEISYRSEVSKFVQWCNTNYLQLNVNKTKEMVIDFRKRILTSYL